MTANPRLSREQVDGLRYYYAAVPQSDAFHLADTALHFMDGLAERTDDFLGAAAALRTAEARISALTEENEYLRYRVKRIPELSEQVGGLKARCEALEAALRDVWAARDMCHSKGCAANEVEQRIAALLSEPTPEHEGALKTLESPIVPMTAQAEDER